jgi:hypothetical protein
VSRVTDDDGHAHSQRQGVTVEVMSDSIVEENKGTYNQSVHTFQLDDSCSMG